MVEVGPAGPKTSSVLFGKSNVWIVPAVLDPKQGIRHLKWDSIHSQDFPSLHKTEQFRPSSQLSLVRIQKSAFLSPRAFGVRFI